MQSSFALLIISWLLVSLGQGAWIPLLAPLSAAFGYALFWYWSFSTSRPFLASILWFASVQAIQLSWLTQTEYMGPLILVVYVMLCLAIGLQFAVLSSWVRRLSELNVLACAAIAGTWVFMEWSRLFVCTGFTWNPVGLSLCSSHLSLQFASMFGVYGLTFWVFFVNLVALRALIVSKKKALIQWAAFALFPFAFGLVSHMHQPTGTKKMSVVLLQPFLLPDERDLFPGSSERWVAPFEQWKRILHLIEEKGRIDLIVLPECAVPFSAFSCVYPLSWVESLWDDRFGKESVERDFPALGDKSSCFLQGEWKVSNIFWLQALCNHFQCDVVAGMDDVERGKRFNAAFHLQPFSETTERYDKRVLVPVGEYIPLRHWKSLSRWIANEFGICDSFQPGTQAKIFQGKIAMAVSICMEETYSEIMRQSCAQGADLLVNLTNDGWFPRTKLAKQHFDLGRIRAVENGLPALRACTTGVTGAIDCDGRILFEGETHRSAGFSLELFLRKKFSFYSLWGDLGILVGSGSAIFLFLFAGKKRACRGRCKEGSCSK